MRYPRSVLKKLCVLSRSRYSELLQELEILRGSVRNPLVAIPGEKTLSLVRMRHVLKRLSRLPPVPLP
jgi:hypothetical protein